MAQAYAAAHPERLRSLLLVTPSDHLQGGTRADVPGIRASRSGESWYAEAAEAQEALADAAPAQRQSLVRATRPFLYGRWDERTQAHAASADRQSSRRAELGFGAGGEQVDVPGLLAALGRLDVPVLVVGAERDAATGLASVDAVAACFPRAETAVVERRRALPLGRRARGVPGRRRRTSSRGSETPEGGAGLSPAPPPSTVDRYFTVTLACRKFEALDVGS